MGGQIWLAPGVLGTLLGRKVEVAGYAIGVGFAGWQSGIGFRSAASAGWRMIRARGHTPRPPACAVAAHQP